MSEYDYTELNIQVANMWRKEIGDITAKIDDMIANNEQNTYYQGQYHSMRKLRERKSSIEGVLMMIEGKKVIFD